MCSAVSLEHTLFEEVVFERYISRREVHFVLRAYDLSDPPICVNHPLVVDHDIECTYMSTIAYTRMSIPFEPHLEQD